MAFQSLVRALAQAPYTQELKQRWASQPLILRGEARLAKGILVSALAQGQNILVVTPTLEEGGRWAAQLESMGWDKVLFYPTSEASPYETYDPDQEMIWGQMQVLADLLFYSGSLAVVATERALQPHLPPVGVFAAHCFALRTHQSMSLKELAHQLAALRSFLFQGFGEGGKLVGNGRNDATVEVNPWPGQFRNAQVTVG